MSFLTILFALLGFTLDAQPDTPSASQGGAQTELGGVIIIQGVEGEAPTDQDGAAAQGGTQTELGGFIIVEG